MRGNIKRSVLGVAHTSMTQAEIQAKRYVMTVQSNILNRII